MHWFGKVCNEIVMDTLGTVFAGPSVVSLDGPTPR